MDDKLKRLEKTYWKIGEFVGIMVLITNYQLWTMPYSFINAVLLMVGVSVITFIAINLLDMIVGLITSIIKYIKKIHKDKRLLKEFCKSNVIENNDED